MSLGKFNAYLNQEAETLFGRCDDKYPYKASFQCLQYYSGPTNRLTFDYISYVYGYFTISLYVNNNGDDIL